MQKILRRQYKRFAQIKLSISQYDFFLADLRSAFVDQQHTRLMQHSTHADWDSKQMLAIQKWVKQPKDLKNLVQLSQKLHVKLPLNKQDFLKCVIVGKPVEKISGKQFMQQFDWGTPRYKKTKQIQKAVSHQNRDFRRSMLGSQFAITQNPFYDRFIKLYKKLGKQEVRSSWKKIQTDATTFVDNGLNRITLTQPKLPRAICPLCGLVLNSKSIRHHLCHRHSFQLKEQIIQRRFMMRQAIKMQQQVKIPMVVTSTDLQAGVYAPQHLSQSTKLQQIEYEPYRNLSLKQFEVQPNKPYQFDPSQLTRVEAQHKYPQNLIGKFRLEQIQSLLKKKRFVSVTSVDLHQEIFQQKKVLIKEKVDNEMQAWKKQVKIITQLNSSIAFVNGVVKIIPKSVSMEAINDLFYCSESKTYQMFGADMKFPDILSQEEQNILGFDLESIKAQSQEYMPSSLRAKMKKKKGQIHIIGKRKKQYQDKLHLCCRKAFYLKQRLNTLSAQLEDGIKFFLFYRCFIAINSRKNLRDLLPKFNPNQRVQMQVYLREAQQGKIPSAQKWTQLQAKYSISKSKADQIQNEYQLDIDLHMLTILKTHLMIYQECYRNNYSMMALVCYLRKVIQSQGKQRLTNQAVLDCLGYAAEPIAQTDTLFYDAHFIVDQYWDGTSTQRPPNSWKGYKMQQSQLLFQVEREYTDKKSSDSD